MPELPLRYEAAGVVGEPGTFVKSLGGLALDSAGRLYASGDGRIRVFDPDGKPLHDFPAAEETFSLAVDADGNIYAGQNGQVQKLGPDGAAVDIFGQTELQRDPKEPHAITALAVLGDKLLVADAFSRRIRLFDLAGKMLGQIGRNNAAYGFILPNGSLDFATDPGGHVVVAHSGIHRVETLDLEDKQLAAWGSFDERAYEAFCGCCNPVNIAVTQDGHIVTAEKTIARVKVYDTQGKLLAYIGPENFDQTNTEMHLAAAPDGRIYVADTNARTIRVFKPKAIVLGVNNVFCRQTHSSCVAERGLREYAGLAQRLSQASGRKVELAYYQSDTLLIDAAAAGRLDGVICKTWTALLAAQAAHTRLDRLADVTMPDGKAGLEGVFFCRSDSPIKTMQDLTGKTLGVGPDVAYEKDSAVRRRLAGLGVQPGKTVTIPTCVRSALAVRQKEVDAGVLSSYAYDFGPEELTGKAPDLRELGRTETIPFVTVGLFGTLPADATGALRQAMSAALATDPPGDLGDSRLLAVQPWQPPELDTHG